MSLSACYADSCVLLSVLSNLCLQLCAVLFVLFNPRVIVFCCTCPHLVFVFKYRLNKMEVDPFGRCADVRTDADRWTHSHIHTQIKGMILWMSAISLDSRRLCKSVCMQEWMSDGVCVRRHTVEAHHSVYLSRTLVTVMYSPAYSLHPNHPRSCNSQKTGDQTAALKKHTHSRTHRATQEALSSNAVQTQ